ncbi:MAG: GNAT family N-acetyltransferase [Balneolaceae bacterium]|nr:GNAT family N-acetyltransferase [Balneolaceae bacterium]
MIKKADLKQLDALNDLFDQYRRFYKKPSDLEASKAFLKERIEKSESEIFMAWEGETATGFVQLFPLFSSTRMARYWLLNDLFVAPEHRGKGVSKALIERAKDLCRETKACGMYLETSKDNHIGNQLYPATDFKLMDSVNFYEWAMGIKNEE